MTISYSPTTPIPGEAVSLSATVAGLHSSYLAPLRWRLTSVPNESTLGLGFLLGADGSYLDTFTPDVAGAYGFAVDAYWRSTVPPSYQGDPVGDRRERYRETQTSVVYAGSPMSLRIDTRGAHGGVLALVVANGAIASAELRDFRDESSRVAALACSAELAAVVGEAIDDTPDLLTSAEELRAKLQAHLPFDPWHGADDVSTVLPGEAFSHETARRNVDALSRALTGHMALLDSVHNEADTRNTPITSPGETDGACFVHVTDLRYRAFARHLLQVGSPGTHLRTDLDNTLRDATRLEVLIVAFLDAIGAETATPTGEQTGAMLAAHRLGFQAE